MAEQPAEKDEYPWYTVVDGDAPPMQGDFISNCPILIPVLPEQIKEGAKKVDGVVRLINVVILSQSCDLEQRKIELVLVCPVVPLSKIQAENDYYKKTEGKKALRDGHLPGYHLMNKCEIEKFERELIVADFRNVYGVPIEFLLSFNKQSGERLRLLPPYREHLAQAFARFFMRVGLPVAVELK